MGLTFPDFSDLYLEQFEGCGTIEEGDAAGAQLTDRIFEQAIYEHAGRTIFVKLMVNWLGDQHASDLHFHVGFAAESYFSDEPPPRVNSTCEEIVAIVEWFSGKSIDVVWDSRFVIPLGEIPRFSVIVPLLGIEADVADLTMRMIGGRFKIGPPPLSRLSWFLREDDESSPKEVVVDVLSALTDQVDDDYVRRAVTSISAAMDTFILAGMRSANSESESRS